MVKLKKVMGVILLAAILFPVSQAVNYAQEDILTLDKAISSAYDYSLINDKQDYLQKDWDEQLNKAKGQLNGLDKLIEVDDKIRKAKKYLEEEDFRSMRIDVVREDFVDFLLIYGYIDYMESILIKADLIADDDFKYVDLFNDDQVLKKYYEFQLKYLPQELSGESRIDMLSVQESSVSQVEAVIKQGKAKFEAEKEKLRMDVVKAYTDLITAQKSLNNAKNNVEESQKVANKYENLLNRGMISSLEYKEAGTELESKKNELRKAERELDKYTTVLNVLTGRDENSSITIDDKIKVVESMDLSYSSLQEQLEKENINLFVLRETVVDPSAARYKTACEELKPEDKLYKEIQDEKDKAELQYSQTSDKYKEAVIQQVRAIRSTQNSSMDLQMNIELMEQKIALVKSQIKAGYATDLDLLKLQNSCNSLKTSLENLKYVLDYQWQNLQYTIHY